MLHGETQYNPVSTFVREIPEHMLEGNLPKRVSFDKAPDFDGAREVMKTSPYGVGRPKATAVKPPTIPFSALKKGSDIGTQKLDYAAGDRVKHVKFGTGTVISIENNGSMQEVTVDFETVGRRVLVAAYARLVKID